MQRLSAADIVGALEELARRLKGRGVHAELYVADGAAMVLAHGSDRMTVDIDSSIDSGYQEVTGIARQIAAERGWTSTWVNEQATVYMPAAERRTGPVVFDHPALQVVAASAPQMLAMKARAARVTDVSDIRILMDATGIRTVDALVGEFFPGETLHERQRSWLADVIADTTRIQHLGGEPRCL